MLLAAAYVTLGDRESARSELHAAKSAFERLGAAPDTRRATELLEEYAPVSAPTLAESGRATRTFMFTDIVKSTNLVEAMGDEAWENLLRWHDQTMRSLLAAHKGEEVKQAGDGFFFAFADSSPRLNAPSPFSAPSPNTAPPMASRHRSASASTSRRPLAGDAIIAVRAFTRPRGSPPWETVGRSWPASRLLPAL
jgi:class 3 adenylate cyclase